MKLLQTAVLTALLAAPLIGCATPNVMSGRAYNTYKDGLKLSDQASALLKQANANHALNTLKVNEPDAVIMYSALVGTSTPVQKATAQALIYKSDKLCESYMGEILGASKSTVSVLGITALGLTTAGGLSSGNAASDLSQLATAALGVEPVLRTSILGNQEAPLIYEAVMAQRAQQRASLLKQLEQGVSAGYVMAQIGNYHSMCGVTNGSNALKDAVNIAKNQAVQKGVQQAIDIATELPTSE
jgi:hypothetical protein